MDQRVWSYPQAYHSYDIEERDKAGRTMIVIVRGLGPASGSCFSASDYLETICIQGIQDGFVPHQGVACKRIVVEFNCCRHCEASPSMAARPEPEGDRPDPAIATPPSGTY